MRHRSINMLLLSFTAGLIFSCSAFAQQHVIQTLAETQWSDAPPMLPPGAKIAVLAGNPMGNDLYTVRLKFPANYRIPAHTHPTDEHVAVLSGALTFGMGDKLQEKGGKTLDVGGFALMPAKKNHYAYTTGETIILLYGQGPVEFIYADPADDPRKKYIGQDR